MASMSGSISGISGYSATLVLGPETLIKIYMTGDVSGASITCVDSKGYEREVSSVVADGSRYSFLIKDIKCFELDRTYTITITKDNESVELNYSPFTYARNMWNNTEIGDLVKALVAYGTKASECWPN